MKIIDKHLVHNGKKIRLPFEYFILKAADGTYQVFTEWGEFCSLHKNQIRNTVETVTYASERWTKRPKK